MNSQPAEKSPSGTSARHSTCCLCREATHRDELPPVCTEFGAICAKCIMDAHNQLQEFINKYIPQDCALIPTRRPAVAPIHESWLDPGATAAPAPVRREFPQGQEYPDEEYLFYGLMKEVQERHTRGVYKPLFVRPVPIPISEPEEADA